MSAPVWVVVGGDSAGGIIVRKGKGTSSPQFPERLSTGALVRELENSPKVHRLHYELLSGQGPKTGWVSTTLQQRELLVQNDTGWQVVAPAGIIVREGKETSSPALAERLRKGAVVEELEFTAFAPPRLRFRKLSGLGPDAGWVSTQVPESDILLRLTDQGGLPMLELAGDLEKACATARHSRGALLRMVQDKGGVLLSAPAVREPEDFSRCLREVMGEGLANAYPGLVKRQMTAKGVFTTTEVHPNMPIPGHTELSYQPRSKPDYIAFFCKEAPPGPGGQTLAIDMRAVLQDLPKDITRRFAQGVYCSVNVPPAPGTFLIPSQLDPSGPCFRPLNRTWRKFGTERDEVVRAARSSAEASGRKMHIDWDGDWLRCFELMPAVAAHPATGELLWTGYNPRFHWFGTLSQALFDVAFHNRTARQVFTALAITVCTAAFVACRLLARLPLLGAMLPPFWASPGTTSSMLEDGSAISAWDAFRIVRCYNRHLISWRWSPGVFAVLDNHRLGHLRTPYDPCHPRQVYTAFGSMLPQQS